jgi:hypothetical protein
MVRTSLQARQGGRRAVIVEEFVCMAVTLSRFAIVGVLLLTLSACGVAPRNWWPFGSKAAPAAPIADEIVFESGIDGLTAPVLPQVWKRNALVVDLRGVAGAGSVQMRAKAEEGWPVRIALRVQPGAIERIEVRADKRVVLAIGAEGGEPRDIELAPGVYSARTPVIELRWGGANAALAPSGPTIQDPAIQGPAIQAPSDQASSAAPPAPLAPAQSPPGA